MLLRRASQEIGQGLLTKFLRQMLCNLPMMLGEVREVSPIDIEAHPHVHAEMRVVGVTTSATKCRRALVKAATYYEHTPFTR